MKIRDASQYSDNGINYRLGIRTSNQAGGRAAKPGL
jgi:hypothetical protein